MFGYVTIRKDDLKVKDYNKYQAYYCGLCQDIKEAYGKKGQATLTFDMTFLSILLTGLYECETKEEEHYCFLHPGKKHKCLRNKYTKYCADMNVLLAYYNLLDDWEDEKIPVIGILYAMDGNLHFWHDFDISKEDENKIWEILSKYDTSGIVISGTKYDVVNEIDSMYSED